MPDNWETGLTYIVLQPRWPITLNLFDAEAYEAAIVVQPLVGNLVLRSNHGRYEPRLAKAWRRANPAIWEFELHKGLVCENGEEITPASFKRSLERMFRIFARNGGVPLFNKLKGFDKFIGGGSDLEGLRCEGWKLVFEFNWPVRSGVVELLSWAPFGYISEENLNPDGTWKDNARFISSGPYRIESIEIGTRYVLARRPDWKLCFAPTAPARVEIIHKIPDVIDQNQPFIIDRVRDPAALPRGFEAFPLIPEFHFGVVLGNLEKGFFSKVENRRYLKSLIEKHRDAMVPESKELWMRSRSMYPAFDSLIKRNGTPARVEPPPDEIVIEGNEPQAGYNAEYVWPVLKTALEEAGIKYRFAGNKRTTESLRDSRYDIRIIAPSIGCEVQSFLIHSLFGSKIDGALPDPTGQILKLADAYERNELSDEELTQKFLQQVDDDAAIITIGHTGMCLYLNSKLKRESLGPKLNIVRFDQLETV